MARALAVAGLLVALLPLGATELSPRREAELRNLLLQDCGSCHGMTLKGGLGPPLTPQVLRGKDREMLIVTILHGRPGTPMPPWRGLLTRPEAEWLVDNLYQGVAP